MKPLMTVSSEIQVPLTMTLDVNGRQHIQCTGMVRGIPDQGLCSATIETQDALPPGFDIGVLSYVAITGYPSMAQLGSADIVNPFVHSLGFKTTRTLDLGARGSLKTVYWWKRADANDIGTLAFNVAGNVSLPKLVSLEPTVEAWKSDGQPGRISSDFTMRWIAADGSLIEGKASTQYVLQTEVDLVEPLYRTINFALENSGNKLVQKEHIVLHRLKKMAAEIERKIAV